MRLLTLDSQGEATLVEFANDTIPCYAILSHTWEAEEVTFTELVNKSGKNKAGYRKIVLCGEQAARDNLRYFWVDTCCIDKSNKAEEQISINSMFRWYRRAAQCYVFLSDVSVHGNQANNQPATLSWEAAFRTSRWHTRGWVLQELLAPSTVNFFSREWEHLGDRTYLEQLIHEATAIPKLALQGAHLSRFSDKERFSWAQLRQTKFEEDKAYSLLGIFDVEIPIRYGEGVASSFKRLEEEIEKQNQCLRDLRSTDPSDDKKRIEDTKGGLLQESYSWILETSDFQQWYDDKHKSLLWIRGDPGKGKTMLLCGVIDKLEESMEKQATLSYFFCQAADSRINTATAVLQGLLYMLVRQQPSLASHFRKRHDQAGKPLFEGANAWIVLSDILRRVLQEPSMGPTYLIIDALDECVVDAQKLLDFIVQTTSETPRVKWIVSSRNWPSIGKSLDIIEQKVHLSLELNEASVSAAVTAYIRFKVDWLVKRNTLQPNVRLAIHQHLTLNAHGTFLWVALICQELLTVSGWRVEKKLQMFPPGLDALYRQMVDQIEASEESDLVKQILNVLSVVYRPLTLDELVSLVGPLDNLSNNYEALVEIIGFCGSFVTLRNHTISFVHQSVNQRKNFSCRNCIEVPYLLAPNIRIPSFSQDPSNPCVRG